MNTSRVLFVNFSEKDFTWNYGGEAFTFKSGEKKYLPMYLAEHFSKHLVDREMTLAGKPTNHFTRPEWEAKCYLTEVIEEKSEARAEIESMNDNAEMAEAELTNTAKTETNNLKPSQPKRFCEFCDSKGVMHKKNCTRNQVNPDFKE